MNDKTTWQMRCEQCGRCVCGDELQMCEWNGKSIRGGDRTPDLERVKLTS